MDALTYVLTKFDIPTTRRMPIEIGNTDRQTLARLFHLLEFRTGVEVGVERGAYSEVLCRENPGVQLFCVDAWKAYRGYRDHVDQRKLDRFYEETRERLAPYQRASLVRKFSLDAAQDFSDGSLDFVYLDGNHCFESVTADLCAWSRKVRAGGIIAGHDYALHRWPNQIHVVQAVKGWTDAYEIAPWFVLGSQEKIDGRRRDDARSFFWVHEPRPIPARMGRPVQQ